MRHAARPHLRRIGLAWLMWLAALLPLGQVAAQAHALSHLGEQASRRGDDGSAPHTAACELCLVAAAIGSGALPAAAPAVAAAAGHETQPVGAATGVWQSPAPAAYLSRAPPLSLG